MTSQPPPSVPPVLCGTKHTMRVARCDLPVHPEHVPHEAHLPGRVLRWNGTHFFTDLITTVDDVPRGAP